MNCPNCAGSITFAVGQRTARCPYCDSTLEIKPEAAEVTLEKTKRAYRNISDTRAEYARRVKKMEDNIMGLLCGGICDDGDRFCRHRAHL